MIEPTKDLKNDECSVRAEDNARELERLCANPLDSESPREIEPVNVLKSESWYRSVEIRPREPDSPRGNPLTSEPARDSELASDLKIEVCSVIAEDEPSELARISVRPLNRAVMIESDPVRDR